MNDGKIYMTDETGREICLDHVHNIEITSSEPEGEGTSRSFSGTFEPFEAIFEATFETKINQHALHVITGTESNNERRRHHEPMRRRKRGFYIFNLSSGAWIWKSVSRRGHEIKPYTHYGRRGQNDIN